MQSQKDLLSEFSIPTYEDWRQAAIDALKGAPFEKKLITQTYEDVALQPIYNKSDRDAVAYLADSLPGSFPFSRGTTAGGYKARPWNISQAYSYPTPTLMNEALLEDLERGQNSIAITACGCRHTSPEKACQGVQINDITDFETLFKGIDISQHNISFLTTYPHPFTYELATLFIAYCDKNKINKAALNVNFGMDFTYYMLRQGALPHPTNVLFDDMASLMTLCKSASGLTAVAIDGCVYHNSGASATQEIAYALATGVFYIKEMLTRGLDIDTVARNIHFNFSSGVKFFTEIAKLRAARAVWAKVIKAFGGNEDSQKMFIYAFTSQVDKTKYDPYVNVLRNTTEGLAAILANADSLHIGAFDEEIGLPSEFSRRVARNIQNILKDEAHILDTIDPAGGSYYIETLTDKFITESWKIFQSVEAAGGLSAALFNGQIQAAISAVVTKRNNNLAYRKDTVLGTNKYPNLTESPANTLLTVAPAAADACHQAAMSRRKAVNASAIWSAAWAERANKMLAAYNDGAIIADVLAGKPTCDDIKCQPVPRYRAAAMFEGLRQAAAAYKTKAGHAPQIYFECFGTLKQYKPRADFSTDFFAVAGFDITLGPGYTAAGDAIANISKISQPVVVVCSTDDLYAEIVPEYAAALKAQKPAVKLIVAGLPADLVDAFKKAGVDDFIHIKSNVHATLETIYKSISVL